MKAFISDIPGKVPTVAQLLRSLDFMGYNRADAKLYGLKILNGVKSVEDLTGGGSVGDSYGSWDLIINALTAMPIKKTGSSENYKGLKLTSGTNISIEVIENEDGYAEVQINNTFSYSYSPVSTSCSLSSLGWSNNSQTVNVAGVTASSKIIVSPAETLNNIALYADAGIICSAKGTGTLTFVCVRQPISNISVNILIL